MSLIIYKAVAALLIFLTSIATIIYPLRKEVSETSQESFEFGEALASGIFLGAAFFHMLPNAITQFAVLYPNTAFPIPEAICIAGFMLLLFLERLSLSTLFSPQKVIPYILAIILMIHSLIEGAALGIGSFAEALMIFIAIMAHKGSASFALCITLMRYRLPFMRILLIILFFSLMTPIGIALGTSISLASHLEKGQLIEATFNAFAAGTFLYISTLHHIRFHQRIEEAHAIAEFLFLLIGLVIMAGIAVWV